MIIKISVFVSIVMWMQDANTAKAPAALPWWQVVTGILGIPAAILGLLYLFWQIRKARFEAGKLASDLPKPHQPEDSDRAQSGSTAVVAKKATITNAEVGDIVGIESAAVSRVPESNQSAIVFEEGKIEGGKVGNIVGIRQRPTAEDGQ